MLIKGASSHQFTHLCLQAESIKLGTRNWLLRSLKVKKYRLWKAKAEKFLGTRKRIGMEGYK
jgi:hypothetical protein